VLPTFRVSLLVERLAFALFATSLHVLMERVYLGEGE
jgi:hypothetical protein